MRYLIYFLILFAAALLLLASCLVNIRQRKLENRRLQEYLDSLGLYYQVLGERIELVRKFRHDLANHLQTLELLSRKQGESAEIQECIEELRQQYRTFAGRKYSSDEIVNAVCELKVRQCKEREIPISFQVEEGSYDAIREADLVGILQNLLDNAVEANEKIPAVRDRGIFLSMGREGQTIYIEVENSLSRAEEMDFTTEKYPPGEHGIGTKVIRELAAKYDGAWKYDLDTRQRRLRIRVTLTAAA